MKENTKRTVKEVLLIVKIATIAAHAVMAFYLASIVFGYYVYYEENEVG